VSENTQELPDSLKNLSINLVFTLEQVNGILDALSQLPFKVSAPMIQAIQVQALPQVREQELATMPKGDENGNKVDTESN
jgi:hypothetical protein